VDHREPSASEHGASFAFVAATAGRRETIAGLIEHLATQGLSVDGPDGDGRWRVIVPDATSATAARDRVSGALRDAAGATGTCMAVSVHGF
jgi:hypothetical protein